MRNEAEEDPYAHEAKEEELAEQRMMWRPMRDWYVDNRNPLSGHYGLFPLFWQDLKQWPHWRPLRKAYLKYQDTGAFDIYLSTLTILRAGEWPLLYGAEEKGKKDGVHAPDALVASKNEVPKRKGRRSRFGDATGRKRSKNVLAGDQVVVVGSSSKFLQKRLKPICPQASKIQLGLVKAHVEGVTALEAGILSTEERQEVLLVQMKLRILQEKCINFSQELEKWLQDPKRPASPPPIYGPDGKRANTAPVRFRQMLDRERNDLLRKLRSLQPETAAALGDNPERISRKLYIPVKEFPNVCFMGLILGPRGHHHKRLETDSGCKVRIRGRGSLREGSRGKDSARDIEDDKEDLHVYIEGPTEEAVKKAVAMIEPLLQPESRDAEELKEQHQHELAEINGTLRLDEYCHICGEKGHRQWECPSKQRTYAMANVRCALCGDTSHPTRDCALNKTENAGTTTMSLDESRKKVDSQFLDFMNELGVDDSIGYQNSLVGNNVSSVSATTTTKSKVPQGISTTTATTPATATPALRPLAPAPPTASVYYTQQHAPRPIRPTQRPRTWFTQTPQEAWNAAYLQQMAAYNQMQHATAQTHTQAQQQPYYAHTQAANYYSRQYPTHYAQQQPAYHWPQQQLQQSQQPTTYAVPPAYHQQHPVQQQALQHLPPRPPPSQQALQPQPTAPSGA